MATKLTSPKEWIMKCFVFILLGFISTSSFAQIKTPVHLSFNIDKKEKHTTKILRPADKDITFRMDGRHYFVWTPECEVRSITMEELKNIDVISLETFLALAEGEKRRLITSGKGTRSVKILFNHQLFEKIYLYVRHDEHNKVKRYEVSWKDIIVD